MASPLLLWIRANRLVDALAKLGAMLEYKEAARAAEYCAALLGVVTYSANHHARTVTKDGGRQVTTYMRDSAPGKRPAEERNDPCKSIKTQASASDSVAACAASSSVSVPCGSSVDLHLVNTCSVSQRSRKRKATAQSVAKLEEETFRAYWLDGLRDRVAPSHSLVSASSRREAVRLRVLARAST